MPTVAESPTLIEELTGRMRPRHGRFHRALEELCRELGLSYAFRPVTWRRRLAVQAVTRWSGVRSIHRDDDGSLGLFHQALNRGNMPYMAEFDVPLALHGYNVSTHRRAVRKARDLMERGNLRSLLVFSQWAARSFDLHFGEELGNKIRIAYPLASDTAHCGGDDGRTYDFTFIAHGFRIKCGPEAVRAFCRGRHEAGLKARMCVVTQLEVARDAMGDLSRYPGVTWRQANLSEPEVAGLLADSRCLVHPSLSDSFGVVALEALAAGCALITTDMASFPELVRHGENGWLLAAPTGAVVGDTLITEYGNAAYHEAYLNTLNFHRFERTLGDAMADFLAEPRRAADMMAASRALYSRQFNKAAWKARMRQVLAASFPELGLAAT